MDVTVFVGPYLVGVGRGWLRGGGCERVVIGYTYIGRGIGYIYTDRSRGLATLISISSTRSLSSRPACCIMKRSKARR